MPGRQSRVAVVCSDAEIIVEKGADVKRLCLMNRRRAATISIEHCCIPEFRMLWRPPEFTPRPFGAFFVVYQSGRSGARFIDLQLRILTLANAKPRRVSPGFQALRVTRRKA